MVICPNSDADIALTTADDGAHAGSDRNAIIQLRRFGRSESGATTIDMVVLAAAVVGLALAATITIASSTTELAAQAGHTIASVYDGDTSGSTGNTDSGGDDGAGNNSGGNGGGWAWGRGGKWGS